MYDPAAAGQVAPPAGSAVTVVGRDGSASGAKAFAIWRAQTRAARSFRLTPLLLYRESL